MKENNDLWIDMGKDVIALFRVFENMNIDLVSVSFNFFNKKEDVPYLVNLNFSLNEKSYRDLLNFIKFGIEFEELKEKYFVFSNLYGTDGFDKYTEYRISIEEK